MNDLPMPIQQGQQNSPIPQPQGAQTVSPVAAMPPVADPKVLLERATAQIEQIVAVTPSSPSDRAEQIQAVKAAYIKARYNLEIGPQQV